MKKYIFYILICLSISFSSLIVETAAATEGYSYGRMGKIVLEKNMVNNVNTLTQEMFFKDEAGNRVPNVNTIFVIQYDFALGEDITIPDNCVLEFDGGLITNGRINLNYCRCEGNISFKSVKINNFCGKITATQLGLVADDELTDVIGDGWKNCVVDLENIKLKHRAPAIRFGGDFVHITRWNINRINTKTTESSYESRDEAESRFVFQGIKNLIIEHCTFDGTGSTIDYPGGNFYFAFCGVSIFDCDGAVVRNNTFLNMPVNDGIFMEQSDNACIEYNYIKNCTIYKSPTGEDTAGCGIYVRTSKNNVISHNKVEIDDNVQLGQCGICQEAYVSGNIEDNVISGYDRGIHVELCFEYNNILRNHITRCISALMLWTNTNPNDPSQICKLRVEGNYLSNLGITKASQNNKNYTPLSYGRAIINLHNAATYAYNENKETLFLHNKIESFGTGDYNDYARILTDYSGKWVNNEFVKSGTYSPCFFNQHEVAEHPNHFYFIDNIFDGSFHPQHIGTIYMVGNQIKQRAIAFFIIDNFNASKDYTNDIYICNNIYTIKAEAGYTAGAFALFPSFGGTFKNNIWGLGTSHYSLFNESNIAKGTVIDNNVFQIAHAYEKAQKTIWYGSTASANLVIGTNILVDLLDGPQTTKVQNPQTK